jgi:hypothetical protein
VAFLLSRTTRRERDERLPFVTPSLITNLVLAAAAVVFLVLWLLSILRSRRRVFHRNADERLRIDLELSLAEQQGRLGIIRELQDVAVLSIARLITRAEGARYMAESDPSTAVSPSRTCAAC